MMHLGKQQDGQMPGSPSRGPGGVPGSWFQLSPNLDGTSICRVNQTHGRALSSFSLFLSLLSLSQSAFQVYKYINLYEEKKKNPENENSSFLVTLAKFQVLRTTQHVLLDYTPLCDGLLLALLVAAGVSTALRKSNGSVPVPHEWGCTLTTLQLSVSS